MRKFSDKLTKSGIHHTPLSLGAVEVTKAKKVTVPSDVRDIDSIFGRYHRLSEAGKYFVRAQFKRLEFIG